MKTSLRAFTLIEMLVVIAIIGLLAGVLLNRTTDAYDGAQRKIAKLAVQTQLKSSLERYRLDVGSYPSTAEGLAALLAAPANVTDRWHGPYAEATGGKLNLDPWNEPYQYRYPGTKNKTGFDLYSKGPDKTDGTDDDIGNW